MPRWQKYCRLNSPTQPPSWLGDKVFAAPVFSTSIALREWGGDRVFLFVRISEPGWRDDQRGLHLQSITFGARPLALTIQVTDGPDDYFKVFHYLSVLGLSVDERALLFFFDDSNSEGTEKALRWAHECFS